MISDVGDRGTPGYRQGWQEAIMMKRVDMVWIWEVFGFVTSVGS